MAFDEFLPQLPALFIRSSSGPSPESGRFYIAAHDSFAAGRRDPPHLVTVVWLLVAWQLWLLLSQFGRDQGTLKGEMDDFLVKDDVIASCAQTMEDTLRYLDSRYGGIRCGP